METPRYYDAPVNVLAREVAKTFGGTAEPMNADGEYFESWAQVRVSAFEQCPAYIITLDRRGYGVKADQVTVSIQPAKRCAEVSNYPPIVWPKAGMNATRDPQAIMADISRRVVNNPAARVALLEYARRVKELDERKAGVAGYLAHLLADAPNARTVDHYPPTHYGARIFSVSGTHFEAQLSADGAIDFSRTGSVSMDQALRILAILREG